jgi:hypothetical protein
MERNDIGIISIVKDPPQREWILYYLHNGITQFYFYYQDKPINIDPDLEKYVVQEKLLNGQTFNYLDRTKWITAIQPNLLMYLDKNMIDYLKSHHFINITYLILPIACTAITKDNDLDKVYMLPTEYLEKIIFEDLKIWVIYKTKGTSKFKILDLSSIQLYPWINVIICSGEKTGSISLHYGFLPYGVLHTHGYNGELIQLIIKNQKQKIFIISSYRTLIERFISLFFIFILKRLILK